MTGARDDYHDRALEIVLGIDHEELPGPVLINYVVVELLNLSRERLGSDPATQLLDRLIEGLHFEIVHASKVDFDTAQPLFRQDGGLSLVDASLAAYLQREDIEYLYSFDATEGSDPSGYR